LDSTIICFQLILLLSIGGSFGSFMTVHHQNSLILVLKTVILQEYQYLLNKLGELRCLHQYYESTEVKLFYCSTKMYK